MGIFEGLKRLFGGNVEQPVASQQEPAITGTFEQSASMRPWEDRSLPPEERLESYRAFVYEKLEGIQIAFDRAGEAEDVATQKEIMNSPETKKWMDEGMWLQTTPAEFCARIDRMLVRELLGKNFLGAEAWKAIGIDVGEEPPIPESITKPFLESACPLHPGEKIRDSHLLVLVPKTVNGEPYSALRLDELCATRQGSGNNLMYGEVSRISWKQDLWASIPQFKSEWVLMPKRDPDSSKVATEKHFRDKTIAGQNKVHNTHYKEYQEAGALELMTALLLYDLVNKERLLPVEYLRCQELNAHKGKILVGAFYIHGLVIADTGDDCQLDHIGRALVRRS